MAKRRALIVDDSKTAQIRLRKMLERFDLDVDTVLSAEEALGYLSYRSPSVIFLDHHMEGMDGLEALKIIKANPGTALIPVIMYTSEQGDVYVGQARALGAIDILSKEVIKHENIEKVLGSLGIIARPDGSQVEEGKPGVASPAAAKQAAKPAPAKPGISYSLTSDDSDQEPSAEAEGEIASKAELDAVQKQVSKLFELHIAKVRQEIEQSTKFIVRRLAKDAAPKAVARKPGEAAGSADKDKVEEPFVVPTVVEEKNNFMGWMMGIILVAIGGLGYHLYINNQYQKLLVNQFESVLERTKSTEELASRLLLQIKEGSRESIEAQAYADRQVLLDAMSWAVNVNTQVAFGEKALNDQRIYMLGELLALLNAANFEGAIYLDVHQGNFCVIEAPSGELILPEPESNIDDCEFLANKLQEVTLGDQVSVGFLNYLQSVPSLSDGDVEVEMNSQGFSVPKYSYPPITSATSAGDWNNVAQKNNRIAISFSAN